MARPQFEKTKKEATTETKAEITVNKFEGKDGLVGYAQINNFHGLFLNSIEIYEKDGKISIKVPQTKSKKEDSFFPVYRFTDTVFAGVAKAIEAAYKGEEYTLPECSEKNITVTIQPETSNVYAWAAIEYNGVTCRGVAVKTTKEGQPYMQFPSRIRMKNGEQVMNESGYPIRDSYLGPATSEDKEKIQEFIFDAVQEAAENLEA